MLGPIYQTIRPRYPCASTFTSCSFLSSKTGPDAIRGRGEEVVVDGRVATDGGKGSTGDGPCLYSTLEGTCYIKVWEDEVDEAVVVAIVMDEMNGACRMV